ncbi:MAG: protein kinase [Pyrinomonadaceae bacterium]|nr:protein kinase [Pyrinomonadaceae bacterium]
MSELKLQQCRLDGRYDILDCLGRGSYSEIYMARDTSTGGSDASLVVIKALNTSLQGTPDVELENTLIENFRNEALALDRVRHPHIISRLGHGTALDLTGRAFHYLVLEYMPGGDMSALCRHNPLTFERAIFYLEQVCAGLAHAHASGVIHRDIKPQNLLLSTDKRILKIADFGVAKIKLIEAAEGVITRVGTDIYAAPEHHPLSQTGPLTGALAGEAALIQLTPAADIYSLAKTVFMLLTGDSPRRFSKRPITELPLPANQQPWAQDVLAVLNRATQTKAIERYQTVGDFWKGMRDAHEIYVSAQARGNGDGAGIDSALTTKPNSQAPVTAPLVPQALPNVPVQPKPEQVDFVPHQRRVHARIVVPVADKLEATPNVIVEPLKNSPAVIAPSPQRSVEKQVKREQPKSSAKPVLAGRMTRLLVSLLLILSFAAMLYALHNYVSRLRDPFVGREFETTTDVNLRNGPARSNDWLGVVKAGSIVRVKNAQDNWVEVTVEQHAVPKDAKPADAGWMSKTSNNKPLLRER